ncbi:phage tail tube protein [Pseudomonas laurylsulfatiphila]|uniref:phage tail tube protein n=1 Tax=Pseudomonas laurylsulfatiphila TaxID=2011015 RepID=UPI00215EC04D|nr:phage tail tube protein [Pseudomonas laurylsulfatiphila]UVM07058.1 phage tail protein [Pseudomonas laurylsulfatiphila]
MTINTQGTELFALDPADNSVIDVGCFTSLDGIDTAIAQIDVTCTKSKAREYEAGLAEPGSASFGLNIDPKNPSHLRLHQLKKAGTKLKWVVGWSDGYNFDTETGIPPLVGAEGSLAGIVLNSAGTGYTTAPTVAITGGGGTGATATAQIADGKVTGFTITNAGSGYTTAPTVALTGGSGTGASARALVNESADFDLPNTRTWLTFEGYMNAFPFTFGLGDVVKSNVGIQVSGEIELIVKTSA